MKSLLGCMVLLVLAFSNVAQAGAVKIQTLSDGSTALIVKGGGFPEHYLYHWFRYATQNTSKDQRSNLLRGRGYYLNLYPTPREEMFVDYTVKYIFDGNENQISVENNRITFQGTFAYLLAQGGAIDAAMSGGVTVNKGIYSGDFQVIPQYSRLMCERVTLPVPGDRIVRQISRCTLDI